MGRRRQEKVLIFADAALTLQPGRWESCRNLLASSAEVSRHHPTSYIAKLQLENISLKYFYIELEAHCKTVFLKHDVEYIVHAVRSIGLPVVRFTVIKNSLLILRL